MSDERDKAMEIILSVYTDLVADLPVMRAKRARARGGPRRRLDDQIAWAEAYVHKVESYGWVKP